MNKIAVETKNIGKIFETNNGEKTVLDKLSIKIKYGEIFIIRGPNGSGKTTLLKILATLIEPSSGSAKIAGYDLVSEGKMIRKNTGFINSDERSLYWKLTGRQNLMFFSSLYGMNTELLKERIKEHSQMFELENFIDEPVEDYSAGMKQKLIIARGLLHDPKVLLMDEPLKSIDNASAGPLIKYFKMLKKDKAVIIALQRDKELERIADGRITLKNENDRVY